MSEMVERVARALCAEAFRDPDDISGGVHPGGTWLDDGEPWWTGYIDIARAAIAAMRVPTPAMRDAVGPWIASPGGGWSDDECDSLIEELIDAALVSEKERER